MIELTELEFCVLKAIVIDGLTTRKEIAQRFQTTVPRTNYPIAGIYKKFNVNDFAKLMWLYHTKRLPPFKKMDKENKNEPKIQLSAEQQRRRVAMLKLGFTEKEILKEFKESTK